MKNTQSEKLRLLCFLKGYSVKPSDLKHLTKSQLVVLCTPILENPCKKKKDELIRELVAFKSVNSTDFAAIMSTETEGFDEVLQGITEYLDENVRDERYFLSFSDSLHDISVCFFNDEYEVSSEKGEPYEVVGIIDMLGEFSVVRTLGEEKAFPVVSPEFTFGLSLRVGDEVKAIAVEKSSGRQRAVVKRFLEINGTSVSNTEYRERFSELSRKTPTKGVSLGDGTFDLVADFKLGQSLVFALPEGASPDYIGGKVKGICERENISLVQYRTNSDDGFFSVRERSDEDKVKLFSLSLERAKRLVEGGKDVVVYIDCLYSIVIAENGILPKFSKGKSYCLGISSTAVDKVGERFSLAGNFKKGSLSIIACTPTSSDLTQKDAVAEYFKRVSSSFIYLKNGTGIETDLARSASKGMTRKRADEIRRMKSKP